MLNLKDFLLTAVKNDKANLQLLVDCLTDISYKKKLQCSEVSFLTSEINPNNVMNGDGKKGYILWISQEDIDFINNGELK